jgi:hypothetical protein
MKMMEKSKRLKELIKSGKYWKIKEKKIGLN